MEEASGGESPLPVVPGATNEPSQRDLNDLITRHSRDLYHYVVSSLWWRKWMEYAQAAADGQQAPHPGPVDSGDVASSFSPLALRAGLGEPTDFTVIPSTAYTLLTKVFGVTGPEFPRKLLTARDGSTRVEIYPQLCAFKFMSHSVMDGGATVHLLISRKATVSDVLTQLYTDPSAKQSFHLGDGPSTNSQRYRGNVRLSVEPTPDAAQLAQQQGAAQEAFWLPFVEPATVEEVALDAPTSTFLFEVRRMDGEWPLGVWPGLDDNTNPEPSMWRRSLHVHSLLDALDDTTSNKTWLEARVIGVLVNAEGDPALDALTVRYLGWHSRYDSTLPRSSPSLARLHSKSSMWRFGLRTGDRVEICDEAALGAAASADRKWYMGWVMDVDNTRLPPAFHVLLPQSAFPAASAPAARHPIVLPFMSDLLCRVGTHVVPENAQLNSPPPPGIRVPALPSIDAYTTEASNSGAKAIMGKLRSAAAAEGRAPPAAIPLPRRKLGFGIGGLMAASLDGHSPEPFESASSSLAPLGLGSSGGSGGSTSSLQQRRPITRSTYGGGYGSGGYGASSHEYEAAEEADPQAQFERNKQAYEAADGFTRMNRTSGAPGLCGLANLGNTCFMNSMLQCLSNTRPMVEFFASGDYLADINVRNPLGKGGQIAHTFAGLMSAMWSGKHGSVAPRPLKRIVAEFAPQFDGYAQHDSQEFLTFLLDGMLEDTCRVKSKPFVPQVEGNGRPDAEVAAEAWAAFQRRNDSRIADTFGGQFRSHVQCNKCHMESLTFDPYTCVSLPIPKCEDLNLFYFSARMEPVLMTSYRMMRGMEPPVAEVAAWLFERVHQRAHSAGGAAAPSSVESAVAQLLPSLPASPSEILFTKLLAVDGASVPVSLTSLIPHTASAAALWPKQPSDNLQSLGPKATSGLHVFAFHVPFASASPLEAPYSGQAVSLPPSASTSIAAPAAAGATAASATAVEDEEMASNGCGAPHSGADGRSPTALALAPLPLSSWYAYSDVVIAEHANSTGAASFAAANALQQLSAAAASLPSLSSSPVAAAAPGGAAAAVRAAPAEGAPGSKRKLLPPSSADSSPTKHSPEPAQSPDSGGAPPPPGEPCAYGAGFGPDPRDFAIVLTRCVGTRAVSSETDPLVVSLTVPAHSKFASASPAASLPSARRITNSGVHTLVEHKLLRMIPSCQGRESDAYILGTIDLRGGAGGGGGASPRVSLKDALSAASAVAPSRTPLPRDDAPFYLPPWQQLVVDIVSSSRVISKEVTANVKDYDGAGSKGRRGPTVSITDCIRRFATREQLGSEDMWRCPRCKEEVRAFKKMDLWSTPPILVLQLKRFTQSGGSGSYSYFGSSGRSKISEVVDFPVVGLDLSALVLGPQRPALPQHPHHDQQQQQMSTGSGSGGAPAESATLPPASSAPAAAASAAEDDAMGEPRSPAPLYDLFAVSEHSGSLHGGHYTAVAQNWQNGSWYNFNDSSVSPAGDPRKAAVTQDAYVLFYRRREAGTGYDGSGSQQPVVAAASAPAAGGASSLPAQEERDEFDIFGGGTTDGEEDHFCM